MKPKFRLGDRVTVINPYVAPIPDYVKDSEIFNDLYKVFGLDKDIRGVKPGDTYTIIEAESKPRTRSDGKTVYAYSYQGKSGKRSDFVLWEDEIKLVESTKPAPEDDDEEPDTVTIEIEVSLDDKAEAHRIAHKAVELAFKSYAAITKATNDPPPSPGLMMKSQQPAKRLLNCPPALRNMAAICSLCVPAIPCSVLFIPPALIINPLPKVSPNPLITTPSMNGSASVSPPAKLWANPSPASSPTKTPNRMLRDGHSTRIYHPHPQLCRVPAS